MPFERNIGKSESRVEIRMPSNGKTKPRVEFRHTYTDLDHLTLDPAGAGNTANTEHLSHHKLCVKRERKPLSSPSCSSAAIGSSAPL